MAVAPGADPGMRGRVRGGGPTLYDAAERMPEWQTSKRWLPTFRQLLKGPLPRYLASMSTRLFPEPRKELALELLSRRLEWLERVA